MRVIGRGWAPVDPHLQETFHLPELESNPVQEPVTWYDVLGVSRGASAVTLRRAHDERLLQLRSYFTPPAQAPQTPAGEPCPVVSAASRAAAAVEQA
jgi:hypothetical protein